MIETIQRIFREDAVTLGVRIGHPSEEDLGSVLHVAIFVHHDDIFREHHLPHAPEPMHHLEGLPWVLFFDRYEDKVVESPLGR